MVNFRKGSIIAILNYINLLPKHMQWNKYDYVNNIKYLL